MPAFVIPTKEKAQPGGWAFDERAVPLLILMLFFYVVFTD
jgi:hypothetical protein